MSSFTRRRFLEHAAVVAGGLGGAATHGHVDADERRAVDSKHLKQLRGKLKGSLVLPGGVNYDDVRRVFYWNPIIERKPVAIVRCGHEEDALRAVEFARQHSLEVAVRSGGHSHLAWGSSDGIVIDLSPLKIVQIDPVQRKVFAQGGVLGGELARAAGNFGLATVLGQCPGVGATGVTLGGGLGWLSGLFGASCDNLLSARIINADANTIDVNPETDSDLFWALCGAGANFGVTTSFEARLYEMGPVLGGDIHFAVRDARGVLRGFRDLMREAPDGFQATLNLTPGDRGLFISFCHGGEVTEAERLLQKIRLFAKPTGETVQRQAFSQLAQKAPATNPGNTSPAVMRAIQTVYRDEITDDMIDILIDQLAQAAPDLIMGLSHYMHGKVCRIAPDATAFPHRQAHSVHLRAAYSWSDPALSQDRFARGEKWLRLLRPTTRERIYANYQTYQTGMGSQSLFDSNHSRLLSLKHQHDPHNFFRRNANIAAPQG